MASLLQEMNLNYYQDVRKQAQQSFYCALGAAAVGTLFFLYAAWLVMNNGGVQANISLIAGALIEVISAINFYLYARAARQFASFHICLERTNRFLLANTICENLSSKDRMDKMRSDLIHTVANAPMLTLDVITNGAPQSELNQSRVIAIHNSEQARGAGSPDHEIIEAHTSQLVTGGSAKEA